MLRIEPLAPAQAAVAAGLWMWTWRALCFVPLLVGDARHPSCWPVCVELGWEELLSRTWSCSGDTGRTDGHTRAEEKMSVCCRIGSYVQMSEKGEMFLPQLHERGCDHRGCPLLAKLPKCEKSIYTKANPAKEAKYFFLAWFDTNTKLHLLMIFLHKCMSKRCLHT